MALLDTPLWFMALFYTPLWLMALLDTRAGGHTRCELSIARARDQATCKPSHNLFDFRRKIGVDFHLAAWMKASCGPVYIFPGPRMDRLPAPSTRLGPRPVLAQPQERPARCSDEPSNEALTSRDQP